MHVLAALRTACATQRSRICHNMISKPRRQLNHNKPCEQLARNNLYSAALLSQKGTDHIQTITPQQTRHPTRSKNTFEQSLGTRLWSRPRKHSYEINLEAITRARHCFEVGVTSRSQQNKQTPAVVVFQDVAKAWKIAPTTWPSGLVSRLKPGARAFECVHAQALAACCVVDLRACVCVCVCVCVRANARLL